MSSIVVSTLIQPGDIDTVRANVHGATGDPLASIRIGATGDTIQTGSETGPDDLIALLETAVDRLTRTYAAWVDEQGHDKIVRGGTGPASPAPPAATPDRSPVRGTEGRGERDADGTGVPPATAPAPLQALIDLIDREYMVSCLRRDGRSEGRIVADLITDPGNWRTVAAALIEVGMAAAVGTWDPETGYIGTGPDGTVPLYQFGGAS